MRVVEWQGNDVLQIPLSALFRQDKTWAVFVAEGGVARLRTVEVGRMNDLTAEILGGLADGDRVLVHPSDRVDDGTRIVQRSEG
jgi:HlyD family secretion protein